MIKTGFWSMLTGRQKKKALEYDGEESIGYRGLGYCKLGTTYFTGETGKAYEIPIYLDISPKETQDTGKVIAACFYFDRNTMNDVLEVVQEKGTIEYIDVMKHTHEKYGHATVVAEIYKAIKKLVELGVLEVFDEDLSRKYRRKCDA